MRFSILIPTRDRLEYLRFAIQSVLDQDFDDWEIVVADNCSTDDVPAYVQRLNEPRITCVRSDRPLPVTDNWNRALERSSGKYVVMLGDDDCLMPGYLRALDRLAREHDEPDLIYSRGYIYSYPGVVPGPRDGHVFSPGYVFGDGTQAYWLDRERAAELVRRSMDFRLDFGFNMQFSLVHREAVRALQRLGPFYQSPFPDYYATNALFLVAQRILIDPVPRVVIGVSPKSYGYFHASKKERAGVAFLGTVPEPTIEERLKPVLLPGTNINDGWLYAMETLRERLGTQHDLRVSYARYRWLQIVHVLEGFFAEQRLSEADVDVLYASLRASERLVVGMASLGLRLLLRLTPPSRRRWLALGLFHWLRRALGQFPLLPEWVSPKPYASVLEVLADPELRL